APSSSSLFFYTPPATSAYYALSLHDALPIWLSVAARERRLHRIFDHAPAGRLLPAPSAAARSPRRTRSASQSADDAASCGSSGRSEEHTSELQSRGHLVCRLLLEKKT